MLYILMKTLKYTLIYISNHNICVHTNGDTGNPSSQILSSSDVATSDLPLSLSESDSDPSVLDLPSYSLPPSPNQPLIEQESEPEVSAVNTDVADMAKRRSTLTEREKYNFYCNHFSPDIDFKFPREKSHSFRHQYLRRYKWLIYSQQQNGEYCLPCVLFARSTDVRIGKGAFVETAFTNFKKTYEICNAHAERQYHKDAVVTCDAFTQMMSDRRESVAIQLREGSRDTIQKNRQKLHSIVETIVLCVRQNIALHGHRDSGTDVEGAQSTSTNHDNFWALLNFQISAGDTLLRDHLQKAARNTTYTSPDIQNQIINILGDNIQETILRAVFAIL